MSKITFKIHFRITFGLKDGRLISIYNPLNIEIIMQSQEFNYIWIGFIIFYKKQKSPHYVRKYGSGKEIFKVKAVGCYIS